MTHHGETQRTSEKAVRKTKHSYNPTNANGYVAKSGNKTDDVLFQFKHNSHFWGNRPIEEPRVTGVKWQLCLDSLKQLSSAAYRVPRLSRATPGNVIMNHEYHATTALLHRANITSPSQLKLRTDKIFFTRISPCKRHNSRMLLKMWPQLLVLQRHKVMRRWMTRFPRHNAVTSFARELSKTKILERATWRKKHHKCPTTKAKQHRPTFRQVPLLNSCNKRPVV